MTTVNRDNRIPYARCSACDSDLLTSKANAKVFCSNLKCKYVRTPHLTGSAPNKGRSDDD